jgi:hypothetical protein
VYEIDLTAQLGQIEPFFGSGVTAPDDDDGLISEKKAVTHGTIRYAFSVILIFARDIQFARSAN